MIKSFSVKIPHQSTFRQTAVLCLAIGLVALSPLARGEPVTTIRNNGDPSNRVDLVVLGDGHTSTEMGKFATDVENTVQEFFAQEPFKEYQRYFNVHRVDVTSAESGVDHPEDVPPISKDTAFDATYNCAGIERLICVNVSKVDTVLSNSVGADQRDMVLVLVNDTEYGGSGGSIAVASLNLAVVELVLHEIGHSFGLLADEYDYGPPTCHITVEPPEVNVTRETDRDLIKWNAGGGPPSGWIDLATPIPTLLTDPGVPGLYEGAKYCSTGLYRPTYASKMRVLGPPFEQINEEQLIKRVYNWVSPLDSSSPSSSDVALVLGDSQDFQVIVPTPETHSLAVTWYVDYSAVATGLTFTFNSAMFGTGPHTVQVIVEDPTSRVRNDPENVLRDNRTWMVTVLVTRTLTVASSNPNSGVSITVSPNDNNGLSNGTTQFTRTYNINTTVTLTAPPTTGGNTFQKWLRNGVDWTTSQTTNVTMDANYTMTSVYVTFPTPTPIPTPTPTPEIINDLVLFEPIKSTYTTTSDTIGCPPGFVGKFSFDAKLTNKGSSPPLSNLVVQVKKLTNGNLLHNADGGHGGAGSILTVLKKDGYSDGILSPGESVDVNFIICLKEKRSFSFIVDVLGIKEMVSAQALAEPQSTSTEPVPARFRKGFFGRFRP